MKRLLALCLLFSAFSAAQQVKHIFLVRHAEKVSEAADAELSGKGLARAECLAQTLKDADIDAIYTSDVKRTQQTAEPVAKTRNLRPTAIPARDLDQLTKAVLADKAHNILIVSHSNLVSDIVHRLGAADTPALQANEYDRLLLITLMDGKALPTVTLRYCVTPAVADPQQRSAQDAPRSPASRTH